MLLGRMFDELSSVALTTLTVEEFGASRYVPVWNGLTDKFFIQHRFWLTWRQLKNMSEIEGD